MRRSYLRINIICSSNKFIYTYIFINARLNNEEEDGCGTKEKKNVQPTN